MNNLIMRQIELTADYQPLSSTPLVGSFTLSAVPTNSGPVIFQGDDGSEVPWLAGQWHTVHHVDLSAIFVKGEVGDQLNIVGGTW